jgi:5-methyltetrahydrofolate--homocysteine methyltransferase
MSDTGFDETPDVTGRLVEEFARDGFLNIAGGCCGTTPDHIRAIAEAAAGKPVRKTWTCEPVMRLSGLEPFTAAA